MQKKNKNFLMDRLFIGLIFYLILSAVHAAGPLWTILPAPGSNPTQIILAHRTATVQYLVQNQSSLLKRLVIQPIQGVTQVGTCLLAPRGQESSSCTLNLTITGSAVPKDGIRGGPVLCQANSNGSPNPNQCYQPALANSLNIDVLHTSGATIAVSPSSLSFMVETSGVVTVTNSALSAEPANNVLASISGSSNINVQSTTCGAILAIGASCTITFTASVVEGPTDIVIQGSNTNMVQVAATVTPLATVMIDVNPTELLFAENSTGEVTVTNSVNSPMAANNIAATIPGGSSLSVQSNNCGVSLPIGQSCTIIFASSTPEGPTTVLIAGENTNSEAVDITVTSQPQISIGGPIQQERVVPVSGMIPLSLVVINDSGSLVNANNISVSDHSACPNLLVNDTNCTSVAPGGSCTLELTSNTPYVPCTITISGSNTANSVQTLIAFSYLGGLVFEESGGSGKVVIDVTSEFESFWTSTVQNIVAATSLNDGVANTNAIVVHGSCSSSPTQCAAQLCRNIDAQWYLPAINELSAVSAALCSTGTPCTFGEFMPAPVFYWSSTQVVNSTFVRVLQFPSMINNGPKGILRPARCIRAFTP